MVEALNNVTYQNQNNLNNQYDVLKTKLKNVEAEQGIFGKAWNGIKELTNIGTTQNKCESMLEKFKEGKISFEEALQYIEKFEQKQENFTELSKNIATGVGAIATATLTAGTGLGFLAATKAAAPIGALLKTGLGILDRATNDINNDDFDFKELVKDGVSGAVTGATSAVASGVGKGIAKGKIKETILNGTKCGLACGAISGSTSYLTDVALEEDKHFNFGDLTTATASSALVSGAVGAAVGGGMFKMAVNNGTVGKTIEQSVTQTIVKDSASSSVRKVAGRIVKDVA